MYNAPITRAHKGAFMLLLDQSGSMAEEITYQGKTTTKAQALSYAVGEILEELINQSCRGFYVGDYFDVAIIGYSGTTATHLLGKGWKSIVDINNMATKSHNLVIQRTLPSGESFTNIVKRREWVEPKAEGRTPLGEALNVAQRYLRAWCRRNPESFPPVVINISDGEATDVDHDKLKARAEALRSIATKDGNTIFINIHLAPAGHHQGLENICFPAESAPAPEGRHSRLLHQISSTLPPLYDTHVEALGGGKGPFRGVCFNTSPSELLGMLSIGTATVTQLF